MQPTVRANHVKMAVGGVKLLRRDQQDRVFSLLGDECRHAIREAGLLGWIDVSFQVRVVRAVEKGLGPEVAREFWKAHLLDAFERPLIRPLMLGALTLYGRSPSALMRRAPQAWSLVSRRCGAPRFEELDESTAAVAFSDLPEAYRTEPAMLGMWAGMLRACLHAVDTTGSVQEEDGLDAGRARFLVTWG